MRFFSKLTVVLTLTVAAGVFAPLLTASVTPAAGGIVAAPLSPLSDRRVATGWIPWWQLAEGVDSVVSHSELFAEVSPYWYRVTRSSTVVKLVSDQPAESALIDAIGTLHAAGVRVLPTVSDTGLNSRSMASLLKDDRRRGDLIRSLVSMVERTGADGVDIDFEAMNFPAGPERAIISRKFPIFLRGLQSALHRKDHLLAVSVPSRTSDNDTNWSIYDYSDLAPYVDRARILTYDYHYAGGDPGPVAPLNWVDNVTRYAKSEFRRVPISIGMPAYGYNWFIKKLSGDCNQSVRLTAVPTARQALALVDSYDATLQWDKASGESFFTYRRPYPDDGVNCVVLRKVWFEAARSVAAKLSIVRQRGVQGFAFWTLGAEDPRTWTVLGEYAESLSPRPAEAQLDAPATVASGSTASLVGRFRVGGQAVSAATVAVQRRTRTGEWSTVATVTTTPTGRAFYDAQPTRGYLWRMRLPAAWDWGNTVTPSRLVQVS